jgi:hypothetical protein
MDFARRKLLGMLSGSWLAQACYAIVTLGIPDLLAGGPRTAEDLAAATGAEPRVLARLLRALAAAGVFKQIPTQGYALTSVGDLLRSDVDGSAATIALMHGDQVYRAFGDIMHTVRTGEPAFAHVYGLPFYDYLDANPAAAAIFNASMGDQPVPAGFGECDLTGIGHLVDVGGGNGSLLAEVLARHPAMHGTLVERADAAAAARSRFAAADLDGRTTVVESDFFAGVPSGADAYVLARILHNWNDGHALDILARIHSAAAPGTRLYVLEELMPDDPVAAPAAGMVDLLMLVTLEGFDRTAAEYAALLDKAGFTVTAVHGDADPRGGAIVAVRSEGGRTDG